MKHLLVLASLIAVSSQTATASRAKPLFEIRYGSEVAAPIKEIEVHNNGAYTVTSFDADGRVTDTVRSSLDKRDLAKIRAALRTAEWDITYSRMMCFAYSPNFTQYLVRDRLMYTARMCSGARVDDATQRSLATIESILAVH